MGRTAHRRRNLPITFGKEGFEFCIIYRTPGGSGGVARTEVDDDGIYIEKMYLVFHDLNHQKHRIKWWKVLYIE